MPNYSIQFHQSAVTEIENAQLWYADRSKIAERAFVLELSHAVEKIAEDPLRWPKYEKNTRRYVFPRFPFSLIYRIHDEIVQVVALAHHKRKPGFWRQR